jgi:gamma-glutamyltranspeptidase / glutathione hydrolase
MRRSAVYGTNGAVASSQPLATQAGVDVLQRGGSAADAAVAVAAALAVTEPCSNGVGGDIFALVFDPRTGKVRAVMAGGKAPRRLTLEMAREHIDPATGHMEYSSAHTVAVPGAVSGWGALVEHFGSGALSMAEILAPAIKLAAEGFPVGPLTAKQWARSVDLLRRARNATGTFLLGGHAPIVGDIFRNPDLAQTLRDIARKGVDGFYTGRVAEQIVELVSSLGGVLELDDLATHRPIISDSVSTTYRGVSIHQCPPPTHGVCVLLALNMLETFDFEALGDHGSAPHLHVVADCLRLAYADAAVHVADPDVNGSIVVGCWSKLLDKEYARARVTEFMSEHRCVAEGVASGLQPGGTVQFSIVDRNGMGVSVVQSNYVGFGTGHVPLGCGFTLHNRGLGFSLQEGHCNVLAGGKRPYHTIIPAMATEGTDKLRAVLGCMGSFMQPQGQVLLVSNIVDFKMDSQQALDAPRFRIRGHFGAVEGECSDELVLEDAAPEVIEELRRRGHNVVEDGSAFFGRGQVITVTDTGVACAGSDGRADGQAVCLL